MGSYGPPDRLTCLQGPCRNSNYRTTPGVTTMLTLPRQRQRFTLPRSRRGVRRRFVLETLERRELLSTLIVTDTSDSATDTGSLRYAITNAENGDAIHFDIPTSDPGYDAVTGSWTITPSSTLSVNTSIIIDGTSQPGFTRGGHPVIVLNGANAECLRRHRPEHRRLHG